MAQSPEQKKSYQVVKAFKALNTKANRTAIADEEFAWIENIQPIGYGNLKVVPAPQTVANVTWANAVTHFDNCNINNKDYILAFQANGGAQAYSLDTGNVVTIAAAGTFSGSGVISKQWKNERATIIDPQKGYFTWDGANLITVGCVTSIGVTNGGDGYTQPPLVTISAPDQTNGVQATAISFISNAAGTITNLTINNKGTGYTSFPTLTIDPPSAPTGVQAQAVVTSTSGNSIIAVQITNPGYGYTTTPNVTITGGGGGSGGNITATLGSGTVGGIAVTNAGSGYTSTPTVTITGGGGNNATAVAGFLSFATGTVGVTITNGGTGYTSSPNVTISGGGGANATAKAIVAGGAVVGVVVTNPGSGYTSNPNVTISGGGGNGATATAEATVNPNNGLETFQGRVWISQGRTVFYSAAGTYNNFSSVSAGNLPLDDDTLHSNINALLSANNFLYVFGDDSINVFSDVRVGNNGVTTFTNTNVSASVGTRRPDAIFPYFRSVLFLNDYGVYALVGATTTKISDALDGIFPLIDFSYPVTGGQVLVNNILCAAFNFYYKDPQLGTRPIQAVFFDKKWFITSQGTFKYATSVPYLGIIYLYGTDGTNLVKCYANSTASISTTLLTALWPMQDTIRTKQALKFGIEATLTLSGTINVTVDSETGSSPVYSLTNNSLGWINNAKAQVPWQNNSSQTIGWLTASGYALYKSDASQYGKYLGLTVTSNSPAMVYNTFEMEHELRTRF
jgi:hypothetical protein